MPTTSSLVRLVQLFDVESAKPDSFSLDKELIGIILERRDKLRFF